MLSLALSGQPGENAKLFGPYASNRTPYPRRVDVLQHYGENIVSHGQSKCPPSIEFSLNEKQNIKRYNVHEMYLDHKPNDREL